MRPLYQLGIKGVTMLFLRAKGVYRKTLPDGLTHGCLEEAIRKACGSKGVRLAARSLNAKGKLPLLTVPSCTVNRRCTGWRPCL